MKTRASLLLLAAIAMAAFFLGRADSGGVKVYESGIKWPEPAVIDPGPVGGPPSDAVVLFDGKDLSKWKGGDKWIIKDGFAISAKTGINTKDSFGDCQLHVEWASPPEVKGNGTGARQQRRLPHGTLRGADPRFVRQQDLFRRPGRFHLQASPAHGQRLPQAGRMANLRHPVHRSALRHDKKLTKPAYVTVLHNGVVVQNHFAIQGGTFYDRPPSYEAHPERPRSTCNSTATRSASATSGCGT